MKKLILFLVLVCCVLAGGSLLYVFKKYNRYENPNATKPDLVIYTHSSFMDIYGPGPEIKKSFEKVCLCNVIFVDAGGGQLLLEKIKLKTDARFDLVMGFDQMILKTALLSHVWKKIKINNPVNFDPVVLNNKYDYFVPYNYSPMSFLYKGKPANEVQTLTEFLNTIDGQQITLPRPAISTPGQLLAFWMYDLSGRDPQKFKTSLELLKSKLKFQGADWSASYGLFRKGHALYAWSFLTSLLYHYEKNEMNYQAVTFKGGHPVHFDYVGVSNSCLSCGIAQRFVEFLLKPEQQKLLSQKNYMRPVIQLELPEMLKLPKLNFYEFKNLDALVDQREAVIQQWEAVIQ